jgi:tetratricopeptide (TPR) repeat protein
MSLSQKPLKEVIARSDALYARRSYVDSVRLTIELLRDVAQDDYDAAWRLGRAHFFLGQEAIDKSEGRRHHTSGIEACSRAVALQPERVEGHFWLGVNLALMAGLEKRFRALGFAIRATRSLRSAISIDPAYHGAGPLRVLARVQHKLPRLLGGGVGRARETFARAIKLAPENTVTRMYLAELLWEIGEEPEARKHLEAILHVPIDPEWSFETIRDQKLAHEKLKVIEVARTSKPGAGATESG